MKKISCFLIYDIISSGMKSSLFSTEGELLKESYRALPLRLEGKLAEQPAESWADSMRETTAEVLEKETDLEISAIAFTAMSQVCLCVNREGKPLGPAFTWSDSRAEELPDELGDVFDSRWIHRTTGFPNTPNSSIRKLRWVKEKQPEVYEKTACMLQCKDYLAYLLTGVMSTDFSDAATTGALDLEKGDWSKEILDCLGIERGKLPILSPSSRIIGKVTGEAAERFGIPEGAPVVMGAGDNVCSAVGAGCVNPGDVYISLGSSSWVAACTEKPRFDKNFLFSVFPHAVTGRYLSFVNYQTAGVVFKWLKNEVFRYGTEGRQEVLPYKNVYPYTSMEKLVKESSVGAKGLLFLPHILKGDSSHQEPWARGAFIGLNWTHTREDMVRAALEGITFELKYFLGEISGTDKPERITVTGIASHERFWLQMIADVFGIPVQNTNLHDTPDSIGASVLAGYAIGLYEDFDRAEKFRSVEEVFYPDDIRREEYRQLYEIYKKAFSGISETMKQLEIWRGKEGMTK